MADDAAARLGAASVPSIEGKARLARCSKRSDPPGGLARSRIDQRLASPASRRQIRRTCDGRTATLRVTGDAVASEARAGVKVGMTGLAAPRVVGVDHPPSGGALAVTVGAPRGVPAVGELMLPHQRDQSRSCA